MSEWLVWWLTRWFRIVCGHRSSTVTTTHSSSQPHLHTHVTRADQDLAVEEVDEREDASDSDSDSDDGEYFFIPRNEPDAPALYGVAALVVAMLWCCCGF